MTSNVSRRGVVGGAIGALGVGSLVGLTGCSPSEKPDPVPSDEDVQPAVTVRAVDNAFEPAEVEISQGMAVRWVFEGAVQHDVVAVDGSFVSELMSTGGYTHLFEEAGDFEYDCSVHVEMTGVVRVTAA
ncbi:amicyanin [Leucobacter sp. wl10]|uniref:cupredoxin domain-containing protein n=1 Tax=Leucobacter sp. wl10 TaxID=2304677 RepID=UPI001F08CB94|nr:amicyanin [Leucobacter sp. wl10]